MKDYIIRLIYCDMLGHNVEFGYIHAVKLAQSGKNIWEKRAGRFVHIKLNRKSVTIIRVILIRDLHLKQDTSRALYFFMRLTS